MDIRASCSTSNTGASNKTSNLDGAIPPAGITQVNEAMWLFHKPETLNEVPTAEIIFFHGLQLDDYENAFWKTWLACSDENVVWPKDWLGTTFSTARILAISYDSSARINDGQLDMYCLGENLVEDIIMDGRLNIGWNNCPIILVGHCLGGIVIKQFILCAEKKNAEGCRDTRSHKVERFLESIKGIFYYATPHGGFNKQVDWAKQLHGSRPSSEYLRLLLTNGNERERINYEFKKAHVNGNMRTYAIAEKLPSKFLETTMIVVDEESSRRDIDSYYTVTANHFDICRPENRTTSAGFRKLEDFIQIILEEALQQSSDNFQWTPNTTVGLDVAMKEVEDKLFNNSTAEISGMIGKGNTVGIHGMGGIGKTTLAKAVFNKLNSKFEYSCFVPNIKLIAGTINEGEVRNCMHRRGKKVGGDGFSWSQLRGKRLLLVLDDVAEDHDLEVISSIRDHRAQEICCIVTTRDQQLLTTNGLDCYKIPFLQEEDAKRLFESYAFSTSGGAPTGVLQKHTDAIVNKCDGLPLTLEVIGKYLKSKIYIEGIWEETLQALSDADDVANFDEKIWKKLRVSYDGLGKGEQQMFLDATTFFSGVDIGASPPSIMPGDLWGFPRSFCDGFSSAWTLRDAKAAWSITLGKEKMRWQTLVDLSLVYDVEDEDKPMRVHEQLQSMGKKIASDGKKRWWKWDGGLDFLKENDGPDDQQICSLRLTASKQLYKLDDYGIIMFLVMIPRSCLGKLKKLEFLDIDHDTIRHRAAEEVFPRSDLGKLKELEVLDIDQDTIPHRAIEGADENETLPIGNLVLLRCSFPDFDRALCTRRLAVLRLCLDENTTELPRSFGQLSALKILHLWSFCGEILPDEFGHLANLERLTFAWCIRLRTLPETFGRLSRLDYLHFDYCKSLKTLPDSFGGLSRLADLSFFDCDELRIFPESIKNLTALKRLEICGCWRLCTVPEFFGQLSAVEHLSFEMCDNLQNLPSPGSFEQLAKLQYLKIERCRRIESLPFSREHMPQALRHLVIGDIGLKMIPDFVKSLPALRILQLVCIELPELPLWLGGDRLNQSPVRKTFHVNNGNFILQENL